MVSIFITLIVALSVVANSASLYIGCFPNIPFTINKIAFTIESCVQQCTAIGTSYAAISGSSCYCGDNGLTWGVLPDFNCSTPCPGNTTVFCGGPEELYSVFFIGTVEPEKQWISRVLNFSSEYSDDISSVQQLLGYTDVFPYHGESAYAWSPREPSGGLEFLELEFPVPVHIKEVKIYETNYQGAVIKLLSRVDNNSIWNQIWSGPTTFEIVDNSRVFRPNVSSLSIAVQQIRIELNTSNSWSWPEIDAIRVISYQAEIGNSRGSSGALADYTIFCKPQLSVQFTCTDLVPVLGFDPCINSSIPRWTDSAFIVDDDADTFGSCPFSYPQRLRFFGLDCNNLLPPAPISEVYLKSLMWPTAGDYWKFVLTAWKTGSNAERGNADYIEEVTGYFGGSAYYILGDGSILGLSSLSGEDISSGNFYLTFEIFGVSGKSTVFDDLWFYEAEVIPLYSVLAVPDEGYPKVTTAPSLSTSRLTTSRVVVTRVTSGRGFLTTNGVTTGIVGGENSEDSAACQISAFATLLLVVLLFVL